MIVAAAIGNAISQSAKIFLRTITKLIPNVDPASLLIPPSASSHGNGSSVQAARHLQGEIFYSLQEIYKVVEDVKAEVNRIYRSFRRFFEYFCSYSHFILFTFYSFSFSIERESSKGGFQTKLNDFF
jgi:hypothetical protein